MIFLFFTKYTYLQLTTYRVGGRVQQNHVRRGSQWLSALRPMYAGHCCCSYGKMWAHRFP